MLPHGFFELLAYFIAFRYYIYLRTHSTDKLRTNQRNIIFIFGVLGAIVGSRLLAIGENFQDFLNTTHPFLFCMSHKTIVGGLLGGLFFIEMSKKIFNIRYSSGDLITYPLIIGLIIGRFGCLFAGVEDGTYGVRTDLPWAMNLGDGVLRHPTNLYEILFLLILLVVLKYYDKVISSIDGLKFKLFLFSYLVFRFFIEFIKPDPVIWLDLSAIQIACVLGIFYYLFNVSYRIINA